MEAGPGGYGGDVDLHLDGPIESTPLGQIHFSLIYDDHKKALMVKIVEACHLPPPKPAAADLVLPPPATPSTRPTALNDPHRSNQPESATIRHQSSSSSSSRKDPGAPHSNP